MKKSLLTNSIAFVSAVLLILPAVVWAQPTDTPTGGNVDANFNSVKVTSGSSEMMLSKPATIFTVAPAAGTNYMALDNISPATCDNPATVAIENNFPCPVVLNSSSFFGGTLVGTLYGGGAFLGGPGGRTPGGMTIYTTAGGLTVDTNAGGGMTIDATAGLNNNGGLEINSDMGGIELNSQTGGIVNDTVTLKWIPFPGFWTNVPNPVRITDDEGLDVSAHLTAASIGDFSWSSVTRRAVLSGNTRLVTRTCPVAGSVAVSCNFKSTMRLGAPFNTCLAGLELNNPLQVVSLDKTALNAGGAPGDCSVVFKNNGGSAVCGEVELECWNPAE